MKAPRPRTKKADKADEDGFPLELVETNRILEDNCAGYACLIGMVFDCGWKRVREISHSLAADTFIYMKPGHKELTTSGKIRRSELIVGIDYFEGDKNLYDYIMSGLPCKRIAYSKSLNVKE